MDPNRYGRCWITYRLVWSVDGSGSGSGGTVTIQPETRKPETVGLRAERQKKDRSLVRCRSGDYIKNELNRADRYKVNRVIRESGVVRSGCSGVVEKKFDIINIACILLQQTTTSPITKI